MTDDILINNGRVIAETHFLPSGYVLIKDGRIASIGEDWTGIEAKRIIDAGELFVSPGFIDMHTHGIRDADFMESDVETIVRGHSPRRPHRGAMACLPLQGRTRLAVPPVP